MDYQNAAVGMDQMARQGRAASLGKGSQYSEVSLFFHGNLLSALGFVKKEEAEEALKYIMDKYPNQLEHLYGGEPRVVESKMDYDWAKNYAPKYQFYVILKDDKARAKSQSAKPQTKELNENKMDAIFFTSNNLGVAGLEALRSIGKRIPDDISVICFDDNDLFRLGMPGISVVSQPIKDIAKKAVEILIQQINQRSTTVEHIVLKTVMIERESVK